MKRHTKALAEFIKSNMPQLGQVLDHWPDAKTQLVLPSISIIPAGNLNYQQLNPFLWKKESGQVETQQSSTYITGQYETTLQLDLWAEYKSQRDDLISAVIDVFNVQFLMNEWPNGISLAINDNYGAIARYEQIGYTLLDSEENSIRGEWRAKFDILLNYSRLINVNDNLMKEIKLDSGISSDNKSIDQENVSDSIIIG